MATVRSLLVKLHTEVRINLSEYRLGGENLIIDGNLLSPPRFPLWTTSADLLVNSLKREFVGVCFPIGNTSRDQLTVKSIVENADSNFVTYITPLINDAALYGRYYDQVNHLEIRWSETPADSIEEAQLDSDYWYYDEVSENEFIVHALGVNYIDEILDTYDLMFSPAFQIESFNSAFFDHIEEK